MADRIFVMSTRPGRILREIEIDLPRPREISMMRSPEFAECVNGLRDVLFGAESGVLESV